MQKLFFSGLFFLILLAIFIVRFFGGDVMILGNGSSRIVEIHEVTLNNQTVDFESINMPVILKDSKSIQDFYRLSITAHHLTFGDVGNLKIAGVRSSQPFVLQCSYKRLNALKCNVEVRITDSGLLCGSCESSV